MPLTSKALRLVALVVTGAVGAPLHAQAPRHKIILVSFDGFSEPPMRAFSDSLTAPSLWSMFRAGACTESVRPAFPSVTPTGHASIWTGAYANVNGIAAIANGKLPLDQTTILDWVDGYRAPALRAEPIWISAARQGTRVFSHMATQSPQAPGYPPAGGKWPSEDGARARAESTLARPELAAVNVYNELISDARMITASDPSIRTAQGWSGLAKLGALRMPPREASWAFGIEGDTLHALFFVRANGSTGALVASARDVASAVQVRAAPVEKSSPRGRALAAHFSEPLRVDLQRGRRTFVYARLFDLAPDLSRAMLFLSEARVIQANRSDVAAAYDAAVRGVPGNGATHLLERGAFGPTVDAGGDGTAELRYFETAELVVRQFMRGTEWGWRHLSPELQIDYLPYPDEVLHTWYGFAHPLTPGVASKVRAQDAAMLHRGYALVDIRLAQLRRLAAESPGTMLIVTGEHGMRPSWATFRPNVLLRSARLLSADSAGQIDLAHTLAAATRGNWISVNRASRRGGIVAEDSADAVLNRVENALRSARDSAGAPVVTQIWRADSPAGDSLGLGGPAGGDLYFDLAPGLYYNSAATGNAIVPLANPHGEHGFPSTDRDMQPALCALGGDATPHRFGAMRSIDIAPTVSEWLGISAPSDSRGVSVLSAIRSKGESKDQR